VAAVIVFDDVRRDHGEKLRIRSGDLRGRPVVVARTIREDALRAIPMRKANDRERTRHDAF